MSRNYRRCGGCHPTSRYCDCKDYGAINFDTTSPIITNECKPTYMGSKCFGFAITTADGVSIEEPQFQGVCFDGTYIYISVCDKNDVNGCVIKYTADGDLVRIGAHIADIGHAKIAYSFANAKLYIARRVFGGDWGDAGMFEVDPDTLAATAFNTMSHQVISFVPKDKELFYIDASADHLYKITGIDVPAGTIDRELVATLPLPGDYYDLLSGQNNGMQTWSYDGRSVFCIRNNPQFVLCYDTITKRTTLSHIGDSSDGRYIGEIEGAYTWKGETRMISACDTADHLTDTNGVTLADIYVQFWSWFMDKGASGSEDVRENTHPTYSKSSAFWDYHTPDDNTTNKNIIVDVDKTNFYCNGSQMFPFHSVHEALAYLREHPVAKGIQFQSDFSGFVRAYNMKVDFTREAGHVVDIRFADCENVDFIISDVVFHDCEFYDSRIFFRSNNARGTKVYTDIVKENLFDGCEIICGVTGQTGFAGDIAANDDLTDVSLTTCNY